MHSLHTYIWEKNNQTTRQEAAQIEHEGFAHPKNEWFSSFPLTLWLAPLFMQERLTGIFPRRKGMTYQTVSEVTEVGNFKTAEIYNCLIMGRVNSSYEGWAYFFLKDGLSKDYVLNCIKRRDFKVQEHKQCYMCLSVASGILTFPKLHLMISATWLKTFVHSRKPQQF